MNLSDAQIDLLRTRPHNTKLWLSIYKPDVRLACQVNNASIAQGAYQIPYDNVTAGAYTLVKPGMTLYVGYEAGGNEKGKVRVRSIVNGIITTAENSHIAWSDDDYLTVVYFFEVEAIYPRILLDNVSGTTTWYKDYDIAYTNQNSNLGFFPCMGSHYAGFIDNGQCLVYYSASGTYSMQGGTPSYTWSFEGATTFTGSSAETPGFVTYTKAGHYTTMLIISGTSASETSYRHISIYDRPENGVNVPILKWELNSLEGSRENSGYTAKIRIHESVEESLVRDGALVVIFADDWYGYQKQSIGGSQPNREKIVFVGYILDGSISFNYKNSYVDFSLGSITELMKQSEAFAVSITDCEDPITEYTNNPDNPSPWMLVKDLDIKRAVYHYLKWHSTVLNTCDVQFLSRDNFITGHDFDRSSLYDAINTLMSSALFGRLTADRQGKLWLEKELYIDPFYYGYSPFQLNKQDWIETPEIEEVQTDRVSYVEAGGVYYAGITGTAVPLLAAAPGLTPGYRGTVERFQGLALGSQDDLNSLVGYLYGYRNARYPNFRFSLSGNYRNIDIAPQEKYIIAIDAEDTQRGKAIQNACHVLNTRFVYDPEQEVLLTNVEFSQLPTRLISYTLTGTYEVSPWQGYSGSVPPTWTFPTGMSWNIPSGSFTFPDFPPFPPFPELPPFPPFPEVTGTSTGGDWIYAPPSYGYVIAGGLEHWYDDGIDIDGSGAQTHIHYTLQAPKTGNLSLYMLTEQTSQIQCSYTLYRHPWSELLVGSNPGYLLKSASNENITMNSGYRILHLMGTFPVVEGDVIWMTYTFTNGTVFTALFFATVGHYV